MNRKGFHPIWVTMVITALLALVACAPVVAQPTEAGGVEQDAGSWRTWVLESGSHFRPDAPPDAAVTAEEITQLLAMAEERDETALQQIAYWNSGSPAYRWNQIAMNAMVARATPMTARNMALLHAAIYDATIAAWDGKYTYNRPRPSEVDPTLTTAIPNPSSPSYPSEYAVTAGAASTVLAWLFPEEAAYFEEQAQAAVKSRLLAGVEYPSDVEAGLALGRQVAELVIARGEADGTDAEWTGSIPAEPGHWTGENPVFPMAGSWQPWALASGDQFRPGPPPAYDSEQMAEEMAEVRDFERTPATNALAMFWQYGAGPARSDWYWNDVTTRLILEAGWADNAPPMAALAYALASFAAYDAIVACFDAKYTYWGIRPFQLDPQFTPLFPTPNHPSYPSAHSCISTATAVVLANLFPVNAEEVLGLAEEAGESRIWGGIHFRADVVVGRELGQNVGDTVIEQAEIDSAR